MTGPYGSTPWGSGPWGGLPAPGPCDIGIPDMVDRALGFILGRLADRPKWAALIAAHVQQAQELDDVIADCVCLNYLSTAEGRQLDVYGMIVGEPRGGATDDDYRELLAARIISNTTDCTGERLIRILSILLDSSDVHYSPVWPAATAFFVIVAAIPSAALMARVVPWMVEVHPAGVGLDVIVTAVAPAFAFGAAGDPTTPEHPDMLGFGEFLGDPTGGVFAEGFTP